MAYMASGDFEEANSDFKMVFLLVQLFINVRIGIVITVSEAAYGSC